MLLRYLYTFALVLLSCSGISYAGTASPPKQKVVLVARTDTSAVDVRHFNAAIIKNYARQREFQYSSENYEGTSLWDRFWQWVWSFIDLRDAKTKSVIDYGLIILGVAALIFFIMKLSGLNSKVFRGNSSQVGLAYEELAENIHNTDLDALIQNAVQQNNYRLAVRLLYLKCLKQLSDAGAIMWDINKTNRTYINELTDQEQRRAFILLTRQFEYVWYGQFHIDKNAYARISSLFADFKTRRA